MRIGKFQAYVVMLALGAACLGACRQTTSPQAEGLPEQVDFNFHIKPILSDRCFSCHGPDAAAREAGLRLDLPEGGLEKVLESGGRAFVPGKPGKSEAFLRMTSPDPELHMPPPTSNLQLTPRDIALVEKWIRQGARYQPHWAFIPPRKSRLPHIRQLHWPQNEIDYFVLARLEQQGWQPAPPASKARWLRRLSFDLRGLPPSPQELDAFLADTSATAYQRVVDSMLASVHFGERLATDWLDVARYADSHGYQDDGYRFVWPWRDWVIQAFNQNMPYDQFLSWQLAGDLLPAASQQSRLATTFLRNHRANSEAGIVDEEYRVEYVADRSQTVSTAMLGLTLECARCHDHKYDPISQKEYYQFFAFFNNVPELGLIANDGNPAPLLPLVPDSMRQYLHNLQQWLKAQEARNDSLARSPAPEELQRLRPRHIRRGLKQGLLLHSNFEQPWRKKVANLANPTSPLGVVGRPQRTTGKFGRAVQLKEFELLYADSTTSFDRSQPFSVSLWIQPHNTHAYVPVWGNAAGKNSDYKGIELFLNQNRPSFRLCHAIPHNYAEVRSIDSIPLHAWTHIVATYDGSGKAAGMRLYLNGKPAEVVVNKDNLYKSVSRVGFKFGGTNDRGSWDGGLMDEIRVYGRQLVPLEVAALYDMQAVAAAWTPAGPPPDLLPQLRQWYLRHRSTEWQAWQQQLQLMRDSLNHSWDSIKEIMVMEEMPQPRQTYLLKRGVYDQYGPPVQPGTPARLGPWPAGLPPNRLGLACWLTRPGHPLTARVAVNRFWQMIFGQGLVPTAEDFGAQGELPSHPALLDWLAVDFVESGWDVKALLKKMVLSATYRQRSQADSLRLAADPQNRLLARGPKNRLSAEMLRDNALALSGLLVNQIGGEPVKPYQPAGLWSEIADIKNLLSTYEQDHGSKLYRRSLYTIWKRTAPPPALMAFDAPSREYCLARRQQTQTPMQALVLMNDPQYVEAARMLAERMMREGGSRPEEQIRYGFRLATARWPEQDELHILLQAYQQQLADFRACRQDALGLLTTGEMPYNPWLDMNELAAMSMLASILLNLDEVIVKQ